MHDLLDLNYKEYYLSSNKIINFKQDSTLIYFDRSHVVYFIILIPLDISFYPYILTSFRNIIVNE